MTFLDMPLPLLIIILGIGGITLGFALGMMVMDPNIVRPDYCEQYGANLNWWNLWDDDRNYPVNMDLASQLCECKEYPYGTGVIYSCKNRKFWK